MVVFGSDLSAELSRRRRSWRIELADGGFTRKISWNISDIDTPQGSVLSRVLSMARMLFKYLIISTAEGVGFEPTGRHGAKGNS